VSRLAAALCKNDKFVGPLDLQGNELTDLAALSISKAIEREGAHNLTKLDLSNNKFTGKAGIYIGEALIKNANYPLYKLTFENVHLDDDGLVRILEAVNANKNILKLHCGIVTDQGLEILADKLKSNTTLEEIIFQETKDHQKYWTARGRNAFSECLKNHTQLKKVKMDTEHEEGEEMKVFKE
jgi:Ran GTPase-activating protein (RanGAP) involved in mRNA processing and transport